MIRRCVKCGVIIANDGNLCPYCAWRQWAYNYIKSHKKSHKI